MSYQCISFLTDYGLEDGYVAACHGVAARLASDVRTIDITHLVPPGDIRRGAAVLAYTIPYLPIGVHVCVVDPGVGTSRRAVAVSAGGRIFVGPDNGLLSWGVASMGGPDGAYELANDEYFLHPVSRTFHGRDVFTPVAARLAMGLEIERVGPWIDDLVTLAAPVSTVTGERADGEVLFVDRFGNLQLSITGQQIEQLGIATGEPGIAIDLRFADRTVTIPLGSTFASVPPGELVAYVASADLVAIAVNQGDARERLGIGPGTRVGVAPAKSRP